MAVAQHGAGDLMGFPSPANDYFEGPLNIDKICGVGPETQILKTKTGFALIDIGRKPRQNNLVLINYDGLTDFARIMGRAFITRDGEAIEGEALDDVTVAGVVTFIIDAADSDEGDFVPF